MRIIGDTLVYTYLIILQTYPCWWNSRIFIKLKNSTYKIYDDLVLLPRPIIFKVKRINITWCFVFQTLAHLWAKVVLPDMANLRQIMSGPHEFCRRYPILDFPCMGQIWAIEQRPYWCKPSLVQLWARHKMPEKKLAQVSQTSQRKAIYGPYLHVYWVICSYN